MGVIAKGIPRGYQGLFTPVSLGYPLSVFNANSTLIVPTIPRTRCSKFFFESPNFPKILTPRSSLSNASRLKGRTVVSLTNSQICGFDLNFIFFLVPKFPANPHAVFDVLTKNSPLTCEYQHESVLDRVSLLHQATNGRFQKYRKRCRFNEITNNEITKSEGLL